MKARSKLVCHIATNYLKDGVWSSGCQNLGAGKEPVAGAARMLWACRDAGALHVLALVWARTNFKLN